MSYACTQRLVTGGQVQIHSPLERWQQQPSLCLQTEGNKERKPLGLFSHGSVYCLLSHRSKMYFEGISFNVYITATEAVKINHMQEMKMKGCIFTLHLEFGFLG